MSIKHIYPPISFQETHYSRHEIPYVNMMYWMNYFLFSARATTCLLLLLFIPDLDISFLEIQALRFQKI